jgi:hypothetical protein
MLCEQKLGRITCLHIRVTDLFATYPHDTQTTTRVSVVEFSSPEFAYTVLIVISNIKWEKNFLGNVDASGCSTIPCFVNLVTRLLPVIIFLSFCLNTLLFFISFIYFFLKKKCV